MQTWNLTLDNGQVTEMKLNEQITTIDKEITKYEASMPFSVPGWSQPATKVVSYQQTA